MVGQCKVYKGPWWFKKNRCFLDFYFQLKVLLSSETVLWVRKVFFSDPDQALALISDSNPAPAFLQTGILGIRLNLFLYNMSSKKHYRTYLLLYLFPYRQNICTCTCMCKFTCTYKWTCMCTLLRCSDQSGSGTGFLNILKLPFYLLFGLLNSCATHLTREPISFLFRLRLVLGHQLAQLSVFTSCFDYRYSGTLPCFKWWREQLQGCNRILAQSHFLYSSGEWRTSPLLT